MSVSGLRAPSNHENTTGVSFKVTVTKPVSFSVRRLRQLLKRFVPMPQGTHHSDLVEGTKDVTE